MHWKLLVLAHICEHFRKCGCMRVSIMLQTYKDCMNFAEPFPIDYRSILLDAIFDEQCHAGIV